MNGRSLIRTRNCLSRIAEARGISLEKGERSNGNRRPKGSRRRDPRKTGNQERYIQENRGLVKKSSRKDARQHGSNHIGYAVVPSHDKRFQSVSLRVLNTAHRNLKKSVRTERRSGEGGLIHNFVDENSFPEIKPPMVSTGVDRWGSHAIIAGSESITEIQVTTQEASGTNVPDQTEPGDTIFYLPIAPAFLSNTRLRLISENYERWFPVDIQVRYIPFGSSTQTGSITIVPLTDPDTQLSIADSQDQIIARAMDYEDSITFNVYNYATCHFPALPPDEEPFYMIPGSSARFEIPYAFQVIANSSFSPPVTGGTTRTLGWLKVDYKIKLYDTRLPELSVDNSVNFVDLSTNFVDDYVDTDFNQVNYPAVFHPAFLGVTFHDNDKVYIITILEDIQASVLKPVIGVFSRTHPSFGLTKGIMLYGKLYFEEGWNTNTRGTRVRLYTNLDNVYNNSEGLLYSDGPDWVGTEQMVGKLRVDVYDIDHVL